MNKTTKRLIKSLWTPAQLPNLELWLDAADINTFSTTGVLIDRWGDKSGKQRHCTSTGSFRPTLSFNSINGNTSVLFSGGQYLDNTNEVLPFSRHSFFIVLKENSIATGQNNGYFITKPITGNDFDSPNRFLMYSAAVETTVKIGIYSDVYSLFIPAPPKTLNDLGIYEVSKISGNAKMYVNSILVSDSGTISNDSQQTTKTNGYLLGARYGGSSIFTSNVLRGNICEIIYLSYNPNSNTVDKIRSYLANKWGITLPTTNSYYNRKARR